MYEFKTIKQKKGQAKPLTIVQLRTQSLFDICRIFPTAGEIQDSIFKSAVIDCHKLVRLESTAGDEIITGHLKIVKIENRVRDLVCTITIEADAKEGDGVLFAYLGDEIPARLVMVQEEMDLEE